MGRCVGFGVSFWVLHSRGASLANAGVLSAGEGASLLRTRRRRGPPGTNKMGSCRDEGAGGVTRAQVREELRVPPLPLSAPAWGDRCCVTPPLAPRPLAGTQRAGREGTGGGNPALGLGKEYPTAPGR